MSNLTQLSKVIQKVVALRIMTHVSDQQMVECFQSAYRKNHSTETALPYVTSAVKTAVVKKQGTMLLLVDFSNAFDTINHNILIRRLRLRYGVFVKALDWVISYLKERTQRVVIGDQSSSTTTLTAGVPQGSVFGPLLFSLYVIFFTFWISPLSTIMLTITPCLMLTQTLTLSFILSNKAVLL